MLAAAILLNMAAIPANAGASILFTSVGLFIFFTYSSRKLYPSKIKKEDVKFQFEEQSVP
jgi:hypothetical protein